MINKINKINNISVGRDDGIIKPLTYLLFILLIFMPFADFLTVLARESQISNLERFSLFYRSVLFSVLLLFSAVSITKKELSILFLFLFGCISLLSNFILIDALSDSRVLIESILLLLKFFLFFLFYQAFLIIRKSRYIKIDSFFLLAEWLLVIYALAIVLGAVFSIDLFKYYDSERWGFKGIIIAGNEASALLIIAYAWFLIKTKNIFNTMILGLIIAAMFFSGTKASIGGVIMLTTGLFLSQNPLKALLKIPFFILSIFIILYFLYIFESNVRDNMFRTFLYFQYQFDNFSNGSFLTVILSGRNYKLYEVFSSIMNNVPLAFLLGGYPVAGFSIEMDFFDLMALLGIFGSLFYFYFWLKCWREKIVHDISLNFFRGFFIFTFAMLAFTGGHMFYSAVAAPFLALLSLRFTHISS